MDIDRIRYFLTFSETGSLVKASEILRISQPALSKALRLLEQELGLKLLEQDGRGLKLSTAGEELKKHSQVLFEEWMRVPEMIHKKSFTKSERLGSFEVFTTYFLSLLNKGSPIERLELFELTPGKLEEALLQNRVDVGITYTPIPKAGLEIIEVGKITMGIFGLKKFSEAIAGELPFIIPVLPNEGSPSKVVGLDGWPDHKYPRKIHYQVTMMESAMELAREGLGVAYLPRFVVDLHNEKIRAPFQLTELDCEIPLKSRRQSVYLLKRSSDQETAFFRSIAKILRELR